MEYIVTFSAMYKSKLINKRITVSREIKPVCYPWSSAKEATCNLSEILMEWFGAILESMVELQISP
jgi:hypothetical protein